MEIIIFALFVLQMLSFYFIVLLYMKMNRFKQNDRQQELLIEEMESSMTAFLTDIQDDNDRLIASMKRYSPQQEKSITASQQPESSNDDVHHVTDKEPQVGIEQPADESFQHTATPVIATQQKQQNTAFTAPKAYVKNAYTQPQVPPKTPEQEIKEMYIAGQSIDSIAKKMQKGKTEIELLIKFQNKNLKNT
ncbi:hypothetical protein [Kurthia sibirica]|uniref:Swarming motility protein SwrB n=1 Tax=Kurthia sibirica TaxID=202750 RepID=A0A2U3AQV9_9BACL|nr:hypothetical protein [Kurthia sibirica]PWI26923.1 hypothetical protein DEX24_01080 [Kurthia sibirica]GEK32535.1 swarming motility protein SwrB [Kurthia sibirica]